MPLDEDLKAMVECDRADILALIDRHTDRLKWWTRRAADTPHSAQRGVDEAYGRIVELMGVVADLTMPPSTVECEPGNSDVPF